MRKPFTYKIKYVLLCLLLVGTLGDFCDDPDPTQVTETPDDTCPSWDTDCDGISNGVETNDANSYLNLDPDTPNDNPSIAHGDPCDGWIENALNLVNQGAGYYHYLGIDPIDTDDWGVLHLINMIEGAGRDWFTSGYSPPRIGVGDLSKGDAETQQFGGDWRPDHECHQNGTEADFRYVRNDEQEASLNIAGPDSIYYDPEATAALMNYLFQNSISIKIIVSPYCYITFTGIEAVYDTTGEHDNHFHLRIEDPDGTAN